MSIKSGSYKLCLFIVGHEVPEDTPIVRMVRAELSALFDDGYSLEVIDVVKQPETAVNEGVFFTPTLLRLEPEPKKKVIGNFSDREKILGALRLLHPIV